MATFRGFEENEGWQKARLLVRAIYALSNHEPFAKDFALRDQIRRAGVSVMSNIAEGFGRDGTREFVQFLTIAKGSANEVKAQLYVAIDQGYISQQDFDRLYALAGETGGMIGGLMRYLQQADIKGTKYK